MMTKRFEHLATAIMSATNESSSAVVEKAPGAITTTSASTSSSSLVSMRDDRHGEESTIQSSSALNADDETVAAAAAMLQQQSAVSGQSLSVAGAMPQVAQAPLSHSMQPGQRVGRWTLDEKILFLYGLKKFGKGRWKKMSIFLPDRCVSCSRFLQGLPSGFFELEEVMVFGMQCLRSRRRCSTSNKELGGVCTVASSFKISDCQLTLAPVSLSQIIGADQVARSKSPQEGGRRRKCLSSPRRKRVSSRCTPLQARNTI